MKLRIAKKVMGYYNPKINYNWHIIMKSRRRLFRWIRKVRDRYDGKSATFEINNGERIVRGTARIVKWNKKYVWLNNNPHESGIRFPWSDIIKVERL